MIDRINELLQRINALDTNWISYMVACDTVAIRLNKDNYASWKLDPFLLDWAHYTDIQTGWKDRQNKLENKIADFEKKIASVKNKPKKKELEETKKKLKNEMETLATNKKLEEAINKFVKLKQSTSMEANQQRKRTSSQRIFQRSTEPKKKSFFSFLKEFKFW